MTPLLISTGGRLRDGRTRGILCILCAAPLLSPVTLVSAEVDWTDDITDPEGDVEDDLRNPVSDPV